MILILKTSVTIVATLLIAIQIFDSFWLSTEQGAKWIYRHIPAENFSIHYTKEGLRYVEIGDAKKPVLLLIHGAPGSIFDWAAITKEKQLLEQYRLIIPERKGYAGSLTHLPETSIVEHALLLQQTISQEKQPVTLAGHSYGGPIALVMASQNTYNNIGTTFGISGTYDPNLEVTFPISYLIDYPIFRYIIPRLIWTSNIEKLSHPDALTEVIPLYKDITSKVILIHGDNDSLVPYDNSIFVQNLITPKPELIRLPGHNHPVHMTLVRYLSEVFVAADPGMVEVPMP